MPLYEYQCASCQKVHEVVQKFSDAPLTECPDCRGPMSKLISMSSFALKGTGWHTTDYKRKVAPTAAPAVAGSSGGEVKPAAPAAASTPAAAPVTPAPAGDKKT